MPNKVTLKDLKPESFRVLGSDSHGHNRRMFFRVQPGHENQVDSIMQSKIFPYRRKGDLLRHALHRHLQWLESLAPIPSVTQQVDAILQLIREEEFNSDFIHVFEAVNKTISNYLGQGSPGQAIRVLMGIQDKISGMPEGYWKDYYNDILEKQFGHLIKDAMKAKLNPEDIDGKKEE